MTFWQGQLAIQGKIPMERCQFLKKSHKTIRTYRWSFNHKNINGELELRELEPLVHEAIRDTLKVIHKTLRTPKSYNGYKGTSKGTPSKQRTLIQYTCHYSLCKLYTSLKNRLVSRTLLMRSLRSLNYIVMYCTYLFHYQIFYSYYMNSP